MLLAPEFPSTLRQHLTDAVQARQAVVDTGGGGKVESVSAVDHKVLLQVKTPPKNILSFFGRAPLTSSSSVSTSRSSPSLSAATPSPARRKHQTQGETWTGGFMLPGSGGDGSGSGKGTSSGNKKRKGSNFASGKREKENKNQTSVAKGLACLFGAQLGGSCSASMGGSGGGGSEGSSSAVEFVGSVTPLRKDETPEVISIEDD